MELGGKERVGYSMWVELNNVGLKMLGMESNKKAHEKKGGKEELGDFEIGFH